MRKLVSVVEITDVLEHKNADLLDIARVKGWNCIVSKGSFKPGDIGIYFEIDSFIPISNTYIIHRNPILYNGIEGSRIKTLKLRGEISQGLLVPLSDIKELDISDLKVGDDLTEILGIVKYERSLELIEEGVKGYIPGFISKTDQERIQNLVDENLSGDWEYSEKLEGCSMSVYYDNGVYGVCSKELEYFLDCDNYYSKTALKLNLESVLKDLGLNIALQGELIGPNIQKNIYKLSNYEFRLFDIQNLDERRKLLPFERAELLNLLNSKSFIKIVEAPILGVLTLDGLGKDNIENLLSMADGFSTLNNKVRREGLVFKNVDKNLSFKVISNSYLLKEK